MLVFLAAALLATAGGVRSFPQDGVIRLDAAWAPPARAGEDARVYLTVANLGRIPFAVLETRTGVADSVGAVGLGATGPDGAAMPSAFAVMPSQALIMVPGGKHLVLHRLRRALRPGDRFLLKLRCVGDMTMSVEVEVRSSPKPVTLS
ncbi:MAG: copper chaperone PCu(A)C [Gemmatimonadales bacterium]